MSDLCHPGVSGGARLGGDEVVVYSVSLPSAVAPSFDSLPEIPTTAAVDDVVACAFGDWSHSPSSYSYVWKRDGTAIPGETEGIYTVALADVGRAITCVVTATNGAGSRSATSNVMSVTA